MIERVGVIGCWTMGSGIVEVCARSECDVVALEQNDSTPEGGRALVTQSLDTLRSTADVIYKEYHEPLYAGSPLLMRMVDSGLLGRKSERGFMEYSR